MATPRAPYTAHGAIVFLRILPSPTYPFSPNRAAPKLLRAGEWDPAARLAKWRFPELLTFSGEPALCCATLRDVAEGGAAAVSRAPLRMSFSCEGVAISGIELEVQLGSGTSSISRLLRRFVSGEYLVTNAAAP